MHLPGMVLYNYSWYRAATMAEYLGKVRVKYQGEPTECDVYNDGTIVLPDGTKKKLNKEQFESIARQISESKKTLPVQREPELDTRQISPFPAYDLTAEQKMKRKRRIKIALGIIFGLALIGVIIFLLWQYKPELLGFAPNSYKVAVANVDIAAGDTIDSNEISYIELSREEYAAQCVDTYMAENGAMKTDKPIFYINANNHIVGKFAAEDIAQGSIIKESMVTTQKFAGQIDVNGETQDVQLTQSQLGGETNITIIARVEQEDGTTQDVVLSTMKLQGRSLVDLLNGVGESILDESNSASAESDDSAVQPAA